MGHKVLMIVPWYPTASDPVGGIFVRDHALAAARDHDVRVIHIDRGNRRRERSPEPPTVLRQHIAIGGTPGLAWSLARFLLALARIVILGRFKPDVIHGQVFPVAPHAWLASRLLRRPWVHTEHATAYERNEIAGSKLKLTRWCYARADRILPVSQLLQAEIERRTIGGHFDVVWNSIDTHLFLPGDRDTSEVTRFLAVGLMSAEDKKNFGGLLDAMAALDRDDWHLTLIGDGPDRPNHERRAASLGIADRVTFSGRQPRIAVAEAMSDHDVLVVPSHVETFSIVAGEGLCAGLPVIGANVGAIPEMITATGGGTVVESADDLVAALRAACRGPMTEDRAAIAEKARELLAPARLSDELSRVYDEVNGVEVHGVRKRRTRR